MVLLNVCRKLIEKNELYVSKFRSIFTDEFFNQRVNLVFMIFTDVEGTHTLLITLTRFIYCREDKDTD